MRHAGDHLDLPRDQLADVFEQIAKGCRDVIEGQGHHDHRLSTRCRTCPPIRATATAPAHSRSPATDSNSVRRAPVRRFAVPMVMINTIMADSLDYIATVLEQAVAAGEDFDKAVQQLLTDIITEHGAVVFNGDGVFGGLADGGGRPRLPNLKTTMDALPERSSRNAGTV